MNDSSKTILIAAHARSGSTYLCHLLRNIVGIKVYLELFHFHLQQIEEHLDGDYSAVAEAMSLTGDSSEMRSQLVRGHSDYIKTLKGINPGKTIAFKVFPKHLPEPHLNGTIGQADSIVVLRRNLLQSYISNVIANDLKRWGGVDTSQQKIKFSSTDFIKHVEEITGFYDSVEACAKEQAVNVARFDYEQLAAAANPFTLICSELSDSLKCDVTGDYEGVKISRQDKRTKATQKVSNDTEMLDFLSSYGLEKLIDVGASCPDSDYRSLLQRLSVSI